MLCVPGVQFHFLQVFREELPVRPRCANPIESNLFQITQEGLRRKEIVEVDTVPSVLEVLGEFFHHPRAQILLHGVALLASVHLKPGEIAVGAVPKHPYLDAPLDGFLGHVLFE